MINRAAKLRFRRRFRRGRAHVENFGQQAEVRLERDFFKRLDRLVDVRRFVGAWMLLVLLVGGCLVAQIYTLGRYYQTLQPAPGGSYTEGVLGSYTNASPLYAASPADSAVSRLIFAGLLKYNDQNQLVGDLAESVTVDERGTTYTAKLKPDLTWQDGQPLTADDVVFTFQAIQNPDAQSPLQSGWTGIRLAALDSRTVTFTLPNVLSSFPYSLTTGLVPRHILETVPMGQLRSSPFNTSAPVGAGPFAWQGLEVLDHTVDTRQQQIGLVPFAGYTGGKPQLDHFFVHTFRDQQQLIDSFKKQEINAMSGLLSVPEDVAEQSQVRAHNFTLTAAVMTFFKNSEPLFAEPKLRQALVRGANVPQIVQRLDYATPQVVEPLLKGQLAYNPATAQAAFDPASAGTMLDQLGWRLGDKSLRSKDGVPLTFQLYAQDQPEYARVATALQKQWKQIGVDVQVVLQSSSDFQTTLAQHTYQALLYGISIGVDPDVFVYWDSSQADPRSPHRFNFSEYKSAVADASLEAGRTRLDPTLRVAKYQPFLQVWQADAPALGMYQPRFLYITHGTVAGLSEHAINTDTDRFNNVENWMIRQVWTTPR